MDPLSGIALGLLLKLFLGEPTVHKAPGLPPISAAETIKVEAPKPLRIPGWVSRTPRYGFVGISGLCSSVEEARQQALNSAIAQIVQNLGAEYSLSHESVLDGNVQIARYDLKEHLAYTAQWFVGEVNENVKEINVQETGGKFLCFLLVEFSPGKIERLRRLGMGPKTGARIIRTAGDRIVVEARENNGVEVTLTDFELEVTTKNRYAGLITLFFRKVPETETRSFGGLIEKKIALKTSTKRFSLPIPSSEQSLKSLLLGSRNRVHLVLRGYDELGRPVSLPVNNL